MQVLATTRQFNSPSAPPESELDDEGAQRSSSRPRTVKDAELESDCGNASLASAASQVCKHNSSVPILWVAAGTFTRGQWENYPTILRALLVEYSNLYVSLTPELVSGKFSGLSRSDALSLAKELPHLELAADVLEKDCLDELVHVGVPREQAVRLRRESSAHQSINQSIQNINRYSNSLTLPTHSRD